MLHMSAPGAKKIFFDCEFIEDGSTIDLISIGFVKDTGETLYCVNREARLDRASPWVRENVLPQLPTYGHAAWMPKGKIKSELLAFLDWPNAFRGVKLEFWTWYGSYDWVALAQLFGLMIDLPKGFPMFPMDLKQVNIQLGSPTLPRQEGGCHDALKDALWNKQAYEFMEPLWYAAQKG